MSEVTIVLLHPGEMGAALGQCLRQTGQRVLWAGQGRSDATRARARAAGLEDAGALEHALERSDIVFSVCPPQFALAQAEALAQCRFRGLYVDANAIAPATSRDAAQLIERAGGVYVDGALVGPPPRPGRECRLYLSGDQATRIAPLFAGSALTVELLEGGIGAASALKMCYAAWNKGSQLLAAAVATLARQQGISTALDAEWQRSRPDFSKALENATRSARKAWRWQAEMQQVAATFHSSELPAGFALAAAGVCERLRGFKDLADVTLEQMLAAIAESAGNEAA